mmetsp:Transcript_64957/g.121747  ORF Transcript_64957/g.121747 Transcript_64957/m.121747 type:complete len:216 (+) Transcript_64957:232-879(+)
MDSCRTTSTFLPSHLRPVSLTSSRILVEHSFLNATFTVGEPCSVANNSCAAESSATISARPALVSLPPTSGSVSRSMSKTLSPRALYRPLLRSFDTPCNVSTFFGLPTSRAHAPMATQIRFTDACAALTASTIWASVRKSAAPSIISTPSAVPARVMSKGDTACSWRVGFTMNAPLVGSMPSSTAATGFINGTSESMSAAQTPLMAIALGTVLPS